MYYIKSFATYPPDVGSYDAAGGSDSIGFKVGDWEGNSVGRVEIEGRFVGWVDMDGVCDGWVEGALETEGLKVG